MKTETLEKANALLQRINTLTRSLKQIEKMKGLEPESIVYKETVGACNQELMLKESRYDRFPPVDVGGIDAEIYKHIDWIYNRIKSNLETGLRLSQKELDEL